MSDDVARAVGAKGATVTIAGKQCTCRALSVRELAEVERECTRQFKKSYLQTYYDGLESLPEAKREQFYLAKMDEVARWDTRDLPSKLVYDGSRAKLSPQLIKWLDNQFQIGVTTPVTKTVEQKLRRVVAYAIDSGILTMDAYKSLAGDDELPKTKVGYVNWWITGCLEGMITFVWTAFKDNDVTRDQVAAEMGRNPALLAEISREMESLSVPRADFG